MIVVITDEAEADLELIADVIAEDNPARSVTFVQELVARCFSLEDMPRRFPLVPSYEHTRMRRLVHGNYLVFYRIDGDTINVLRILSGERDYEKIVFPEEN